MLKATKVLYRVSLLTNEVRVRFVPIFKEEGNLVYYCKKGTKTRYKYVDTCRSEKELNYEEKVPHKGVGGYVYANTIDEVLKILRNNTYHFDGSFCGCITFHHKNQPFMYPKIIIGNGKEDACLENLTPININK